MSTIASPRESSVTGRRLPQISTPTSSSRPSIDSPSHPNARSADASPSRSAAAPPTQPRRNRAALREYYNLKKEDKSAADDASSEYSINDHSDVQESELDRVGFDGEAYVKHVLETQSLEELLKTYHQVLIDIRALDAEKKALVYDNYSKLIAATDTIRRMRANMDPLNPMAATLSPAIAEIYERANALKAELQASMSRNGGQPSAESGSRVGTEEDEAQLERAREVARRVLGTPERIRGLVAEGQEEEARTEWEAVRAVLERWKEEGKGGVEDVQDCIEDGDAALRGEPPGEKSWVNIRSVK